MLKNFILRDPRIPAFILIDKRLGVHARLLQASYVRHGLYRLRTIDYIIIYGYALCMCSDTGPAGQSVMLDKTQPQELTNKLQHHDNLTWLWEITRLSRILISQHGSLVLIDTHASARAADMQAKNNIDTYCIIAPVI